jgi:hypothetical protein
MNMIGSSVTYEVSGLTAGKSYGLFAKTTNAEYRYATLTADKQMGVDTSNALCPTLFFRSSGDSDVCSFVAPGSQFYIGLSSPAVFDCTITLLAQ